MLRKKQKNMKKPKKTILSSARGVFVGRTESFEVEEGLSQKNLNKNRGFTLIELLISLAMIAIVTGSALQIARFSDTHKSLTLAIDEFRAGLRTAQSSALSIPNPDGRHVCGFGMYIRSGVIYDLFYTYATDAEFTLDPGACFNGVNYKGYDLAIGHREVVQTSTLSSGLSFGPQIGRSIFFIVPYGEVYANDGSELGGDVTYTITNAGNASSKSITDNEFGRMQ